MKAHKKPTNNQATLQLFYEYCWPQNDNVCYTLKNYDHEGYPSLHRLYMEIADPTEYRFALECFVDFNHWLKVRDASWFKPYLTKWRKELQTKIRSEALVQIKLASQNGGPIGFAASKFLLEKDWADKDHGNSKRGRPSKEEIKQAAFEIAEDKDQIEDDLKRLGIN